MKNLTRSSLKMSFLSWTFREHKIPQKFRKIILRAIFLVIISCQRVLVFREVGTPPKWCDTPPWYLVSHRRICAIARFATYRAIIVRYPTKTSSKGFWDTIATSIARYEEYRCWASKEPRACWDGVQIRVGLFKLCWAYALCGGWGRRNCGWVRRLRCLQSGSSIRSRPGKPNQRKGQKRKVHEFHPFLWILVFFLSKTSTIHILNFCSGMPPGKVHELAFLWFGLPVWLLMQSGSSNHELCDFKIAATRVAAFTQTPSTPTNNTWIIAIGKLRVCCDSRRAMSARGDSIAISNLCKPQTAIQVT